MSSSLPLSPRECLEQCMSLLLIANLYLWLRNAGSHKTVSEQSSDNKNHSEYTIALPTQRSTKHLIRLTFASIVIAVATSTTCIHDLKHTLAQSSISVPALCEVRLGICQPCSDSLHGFLSTIADAVATRKMSSCSLPMCKYSAASWSIKRLPTNRSIFPAPDHRYRRPSRDVPLERLIQLK